MKRGNIAAFMRRDIEGGVKLYRQSIEADASRWDAHYFLGRVLASAGKADEAVAPLETAARLAPFNAAVLEELANAHAARGGTAGWEGASDALRRAAAANVHTSSRSLLKLGQLALGVGRAADALNAYRDASEMNPWQTQPTAELANLLLRLDPAAGDPAAALAAAATAQDAAAGGERSGTAAKAAVESSPGGFADACDLHDAILVMGEGTPSPALRKLCASRRRSNLGEISSAEISTDDKQRLAKSACDMLLPYAELAKRAETPAKGGDKRCVVRVGAEAVSVLIAPGASLGGNAGGNGVVVSRGRELIVEGEGAEASALEAHGLARHFLVEDGATLTLRGLTLRGGRSLLSGGGSVLALPGSALRVADAKFDANRALMGSGGAIAARGAAVSLARVTLTSNEATWRGGALSLSSLAFVDDEAAPGFASARAALGQAEASLDDVHWKSNRAGRGGDDVTISGEVTISPPPSQLAAAVELSAAASGEGGEDGGKGVGAARGLLGGAGGGRGLRFSDASMLALECTAETLEVLELRGLESIALALLQRAGGSDPHAPSAFSFHLNLLYTHGLDAQAVERLRAYRLAVPDSPTHANYAAILSNQSAPTLRQRGQTINGQVARMREGIPTVTPHATRASAQDAATEAFLQAAALSPADGDIWHDLGTALFFAGEMSEASLVYAYGLSRAPAHPALRKEVQKAKAFPLPPTSSDAIAERLRTARALDAASPIAGIEFEAVQLPEGSYGNQPSSYDLQGGDDYLEMFGTKPSVYVSSKPLLPKAVCAHFIATAEAWAKKNGGWTTARHYSVATTDVPLIDLPELLPSFNQALHEALLPALASLYPKAAPLASRLRVLDCFLVRYDAEAQNSLSLHTDQSLLSFTIALNDPTEYEGGGTFFRGAGRAIDAPAAGHAIMFPGKAEHAGEPITKGRRYIVVLFMGYEANRMSKRESGFVLDAFKARTEGGSAQHVGKDEL